MKLIEIADMLGGRITSGHDIEISGVCGVNDAKNGQITYLTDPKLTGRLINSQASAVLIKRTHPDIRIHQVVIDNPSTAFSKLLRLFYSKPFTAFGVIAGAYISEGVTLGKDISIYPGAYICHGASIGEKTVIHPGVFIGENTIIGQECIIYPNVSILESVTIGSRVIIQPGAVIGSDGFGYEMDAGRFVKIPQVGTVIIDDDVEIGANTTIDRATTGATKIGAGTKIDNLVQIAHNVEIGQNSILIAQSGIAGSSTLGNYVVLAGQVGIADHVEIEAGTRVGAQSGVMEDLKKGAYMGSPSLPHLQYKRSHILFAKLPELNERISSLEKQLAEITKDKNT
ncbi:MAG: UDP-3-O-(3-hydroxymyristoyl)glucosamine N-acyltransferase [Nitrospirae bacterium]|uniref:UDP-3-O-(3-hydroxymyristoyl)glucosamine N-acyltransferase n=1 Tax=Candidatus Magnetominusculus dajiuhuensis TaxID=3137712 RepID=UPI0019E5C678|nr:UDP-3-O-(3-hydroxymyristoyl)glucosamine N-acyltransferase [Nitrospirota bacterium]